MEGNGAIEGRIDSASLQSFIRYLSRILNRTLEKFITHLKKVPIDIKYPEDEISELNENLETRLRFLELHWEPILQNVKHTHIQSADIIQKIRSLLDTNSYSVTATIDKTLQDVLQFADAIDEVVETPRSQTIASDLIRAKWWLIRIGFQIPESVEETSEGQLDQDHRELTSLLRAVANALPQQNSEQGNNNNEADLEAALQENQAPAPRKKWRDFINLETVYLFGVNLALIISLALDSHSECSGKVLRHWCIVMVVVQYVILFGGIIVSRLRTSESDSPHVRERKISVGTIVFIITQLTKIFWFAWDITGIVWTFQSKSCSSNSVYLISMILAIWNMIIIGLLLLASGVICLVMIYLIRKKAAPNSASNKLIKKMTIEKPYKEGLFLKEDSTCAICLCEYEEDEKIRILRCEHHFHSECITVWLKKNKVCPFCKREIDGNWDIKKDAIKDGQPNETITDHASDDEEENLINRRTEVTV